MKIVKVLKRFQFEGHELMVAKVKGRYFNSHVITKDVVNQYGFRMPLTFSHRQTIKSMIEQSLAALESFKKMGADMNNLRKGEKFDELLALHNLPRSVNMHKINQ